MIETPVTTLSSIPPSLAGRVLAVDDVPANREFVRRLLTAQGYSVDTAEDGHSALASIATHPPDIILLDVQMPDIDGFAV